MKIFIVGATGRMGGEIRRLIAENKKLQFVGGLGEKSDSTSGIEVAFPKVPKGIDVVIDFSGAELFSKTLGWCAKHQLPLLSGTTGITAEEKKKIANVGKKAPILWTANTSPGVHWVKKIFKALKIPQGFDVQIVETHHNRKKDKPSGTALLLQEPILAQKKDAPTPLSVRGGGVFGIHRIELMAEDETITIEHQALSRTLFARGALDAALWLAKKKPGVYTMDDFLDG